jgi:hypothetical protein
LSSFDEVGRWKVKCGTEIVDCVYDAKPGPVESVNCSACNVADRDTTLSWSEPDGLLGSRRVVVEVTPHWRAIMAVRRVDWSTQALRYRFPGRWDETR